MTRYAYLRYYLHGNIFFNLNFLFVHSSLDKGFDMISQYFPLCCCTDSVLIHLK